MAYYDALIAKWATLTGTTDQKIAAVNALTVAGPRKAVQIADVMTYLRSNALWLPIKAAAAAGMSVGAEAAVDLNSDMRMQTIDFDLPIVAGMLADLVSKALLTQAQSDALNALANTTIPWWQASGYSRPIEGADLALAGIEGTPWQYTVVDVTMDNVTSSITATAQFWDSAAPQTKYIRSVSSLTLSDVDIGSWALRMASDLAVSIPASQSISKTTATVGA